MELLEKLNPAQIFFAYDTPDDYEPLVVAGRMLQEAGFTMQSRKLRCYVLIGYPKDTIDSAENRLRQTLTAGFWPMAMLWKDDKHIQTREWKHFQREWARMAIMAAKQQEMVWQ